MSSNKAPINIIENLQNEISSNSNFSKKQETSNTTQMNNSSFNEITSYYQSPLLQTLATAHQRTKSNILSNRYSNGNNTNNWQDQNQYNKNNSNQQQQHQQYQPSQKPNQIPQQSEYNVQTFQNKENIQTPIHRNNVNDQGGALHSFGNQQTSSKKSQVQLSTSKQGTPIHDFLNHNSIHNQLSQQSKSIINEFNSMYHNRSRSIHNDQLQQNNLSNNPQISIQAYNSNNQKNFYPSNQDLVLNQINSNNNANQLKDSNNSTGFKTSNLQSDRMNEYIQKLNFVSNQTLAKNSNMKMFAQPNVDNIPSNFFSHRSQSQHQSSQNQSQFQMQCQSSSQQQPQLMSSQSQAVLFQPINNMGNLQFQQNNILKRDEPLKEKILNIDLSNIHQNSHLNILNNNNNNHNNQNSVNFAKQQNSQSQVNLANFFSQNSANQNSINLQNFNNYNSINSNSNNTNPNQSQYNSYNNSNNINNLQKSSSQTILGQGNSLNFPSNINNQNFFSNQPSIKSLKSPTKHILHKIFNQSGRFFEDLKSDKEISTINILKQGGEKKIIIQQQPKLEIQGQAGELVLTQLQKNQNIIKIKENDNGQSLVAINGSLENNELEDGDSTHYKYSTRDSKTMMNNKQLSEQQRLFKKKFNQLKKDEVSKIVFESIESLHRPIQQNDEQLLDLQRNKQNLQTITQKCDVIQHQLSQVNSEENSGVNHKHYKKQLLENIVKELEKDQSFENICKKNYQTLKSTEKRRLSKDNVKLAYPSPNEVQESTQDQIKQTSIFNQDFESNKNQMNEFNKTESQVILTLQKKIEELQKQNTLLQQNQQIQNYIRLQSQMMKQEGQIKLLTKELKIQKQLNQDLEQKLDQYLNNFNFNSVRNY